MLKKPVTLFTVLFTLNFTWNASKSRKKNSKSNEPRSCRCPKKIDEYLLILRDAVLSDRKIIGQLDKTTLLKEFLSDQSSNVKSVNKIFRHLVGHHPFKWRVEVPCGRPPGESEKYVNLVKISTRCAICTIVTYYRHNLGH